MLTALAVVLAPVALGALLGLWPAFGKKGAGPASTFAVSAAATVVVTELLPASAAAAGGWALLVFLAALVAPAMLERVLRGRGHAVTSALGLVGVLLHQALDGVEVGMLWDSPAGPGVAFGVAAHGVPLVAVVVQPFAHRRAIALSVGAALLLATGLGALAGQAGAGSLPDTAAWLPALVAGLLLHVIWHTLDAPPPRSRRARSAELFALVAGVAVPLVLPELGPGHSHGDPTLLPFLLDLTLETAPMLLVGLVLGALLQTLGPQIPARWLASNSRFGSALRGALVGAPLPLCACSVLPVSEGLRQKRASAALVVAFLLATPELGIETFVLSLQFLGLPLSVFRLVGAVVASLVAALVVARYAPVQASGTADLPGASGGQDRWRAAVHALDELVYHIGPWVAVGVVTAALIEVFVTPELSLALASTGLDLPLVSLLAVPSYICATSATPLAGVLWAKGLSSGAVLAGLLLGPATNVATLAFLRRAYGNKATVRGLAAFVAVVWTFAVLATLLLPGAPPLAAEDAHDHDFGWLTWTATALLAALGLRNVWQVGPRAWFASLADASGTAHASGLGDAHGHSHSHGHGHSHGHSHSHSHSKDEPPAQPGS